jgi:hypothetical protein
MTVENLAPGRELDAAVARKMGGVIHWADELTGSTEYAPLVEDEGSWYMGKATTTTCPFYSTDIAAAWQVVEKFNLSVIRADDDEWMCGRAGNSEYSYVYNNGLNNMVELAFPEGFKLATTAAHAICLAFLAIEGGNFSGN